MTHNPLISMVPPARIELAAHGLGILKMAKIRII
jgi:hypothetical protein